MADPADGPSPQAEFDEAVRLLAHASLTHPVLKTTNRLAWAVEEELHRGTDGREYLVPTSGDDEWTITLGHDHVVAELPYSINPVTADGAAILNSEGDAHSINWHRGVRRVGPSHVTALGTPSAADNRTVAAVSVERLGELLTSAFISARPGVELVHDPSWQLHRHPLAHLRPPSER